MNNLAPATLPESCIERRARGKIARRELPRHKLAELSSAARHPMAIIAEQNTTRLQELVPLRAERMSQSPFAFYRGTAAIMAADLAAEPTTGILVPSCGDAHVANFGFYASPQQGLTLSPCEPRPAPHRCTATAHVSTQPPAPETCIRNLERCSTGQSSMRRSARGNVPLASSLKSTS